MKRWQKFIVVPFRLIRGRPIPQVQEVRKAASEQDACRIARAMVDHWDAVAAYEVHVDEETGDMHDPRELVVHGRVPSLEQLEAMAA